MLHAVKYGYCVLSWFVCYISGYCVLSWFVLVLHAVKYGYCVLS